MRRLLFALVITLFLPPARADGPRAGDGGWAWQNPLPTNSMIQGIHFTSPTTGWAVGDGGTILHTRDGGATWTAQDSGTDAILAFGQFQGATGWLIGFRAPVGGPIQAVLLCTRDGGATWQPQDPGTSELLTSVYIMNSRVAWLVGDAGTVRRTMDGGVTWDAVPTGAGTRLYDVSFSGGYGWIVGGDSDYTSRRTLLRTRDAGNTWTGGVTIPGVPLMQVGFPQSTTIGWATTADAKLLHSTDQGATWTTVDTDARGTAFQFVLGVGWLYGGADVWRSDDNGATWKKQPWRTDSSPDALKFINQQLGYSVRDYKPYRTDDGGDSWRPLFPDSPNPRFVAASFPNAREGWALISDGSAWHTTDAGEHWIPTATGFPGDGSPLGGYASDVAFPDPGHGWIVGGGGAILHTDDGGKTWQPQTSGATGDFSEIQALDAEHAWARGYDAFVRTRDGGKTWNPLPNGGRFDFVDPDIGYRVLLNVVQRTKDGGLTWADEATLDPAYLMSRIDFLDADNGLLGGTFRDDSGWPRRTVLLRTRDGGRTWTEEHIGADWSEPVLAVRLFGPDDMWAMTVGWDYRSTDGGRTWMRHRLGSSWILADAAFPDPWNGWAVGPQGTILHTRTGGLSPGDVNADGEINAADAALALAIAGGLSGGPGRTALADVDGDGRATLADATAMLRKPSPPRVTLEGILFANTKHLYSPYGTHMLRAPSGALTPLLSARVSLAGYEGRNVRLTGQWLPDYDPKEWGSAAVLNVTWLSAE